MAQDNQKNELQDIFMLTSTPNTAPLRVEALLEELNTAEDDWEKVDILNHLAIALPEDEAQQALSFSQQALELVTQLSAETPCEQQCVATTLQILSKLSYLHSDYNAALSYGFDALSRFEVLDDVEVQANILYIIARTYFMLDAYPESLTYFFKVQELWETLGLQRGQVLILKNIGQLYTNLEEYTRALAYLKRSLKMAQEIGDQRLQADALAHSANAYTALGDYENALRCGLESVKLYDVSGSQQGQAEALTNIGCLYQAQGEYTPALVYFEQALDIFQNLAIPYGVASVLSHMGQSYAQDPDQIDLARSHLERALKIAQDIGARQVGYDCHHTLVKIHKQAGFFEKALVHYEQFHVIRESVFNQQADQRIKHLNIAYEVASAVKEAEIAHLRNIELEREIAERKRAEAALRASSARTNALYQLVRTLAAYDTLPTMLQAVAKTVANKLPASQVVLHTFDPEKKQVTYFVEGRGDVEHPYHPPFDDLMDTVIGWSVLKEQPVLSPRDRPDPRESKRIQRQRVSMNLGSVIVIPLYYGGDMFGTLTAINYTEEPQFGTEDLALLRAMSSQIAIAISNFQRSEEMARLKEFNESIVQGVGEAILIEDNRGFLTFANPAAENLLGYTQEELIGQHWSKFFSEEEVERISSQETNPISTLPLHYETLLKHKQGQFIPAIVSIAPLRQEGKNVGVLAAFTDITELKKAEETLRQRSFELELQNAELDAFAHTVAHDLRSPLTTVVGFSDLLATRFEDLSEDRRQYGLQAISESGHKMSEIINELLLLANMRANEVVESQPLDMATLIAEVQNRLSYQLESNEVSLSLPEDWPVAWGHAPWVEEVWVNYISNAIKYGGEPPEIELGFDELKPVDEAHSLDLQAEDLPEQVQLPCAYIRFWVRDNGCGLSPEAQRRLFMPFERLNKTHIEGHGLGLSIVRRIVEKLGGEVGVESTLEQGATFFFTLPCTEPNPDD